MAFYRVGILNLSFPAAIVCWSWPAIGCCGPCPAVGWPLTDNDVSGLSQPAAAFCSAVQRSTSAVRVVAHRGTWRSSADAPAYEVTVATDRSQIPMPMSLSP